MAKEPESEEGEESGICELFLLFIIAMITIPIINISINLAILIELIILIRVSYTFGKDQERRKWTQKRKKVK